jgi:hypothetical protein
MSIHYDDAPEVVRCVECGHPGDAATTIPALDGHARRCADHDGCEERKESRAAFATT